MAGVPVSVVPPTADGRLFPRYQNSIGILTLGTSAPRSCPTGIKIDSLILDFDEDGLLAVVELMTPMRKWKAKADTARPGGSAGNILLRDPRRGSIEHNWPVTVSFDVQSDAGRVGFGSGDYNRAVELSARCHALLLDDDLTGFWFALAR